jgi:hypothetical protein
MFMDNQVSTPKNKFTVYLTESAEQRFNEMYAYKVIQGEKDTKSDIICDALQLLHKRMFNKFGKKKC